VLTARWGTAAALLADLLGVTGHLLIAPAGLSGATISALAVTVLVGALMLSLAGSAGLGRISTSVPLTGRAVALRAKSWRAAFLPQRDPDAAGRPRPRAPSAVQAAA